MSGIETALAVGGFVADRIVDHARQLRDEKGWHKRLAKSAARDCEFDVSKRNLRRLLKSRPLQAALERVDEAAEAEIARLVQPAVKSGDVRANDDGVDSRPLDLARTLRLAFLRHLDQPYRDQVIHDSLARKIDALVRPHAESSHESESVLPPTCREKLHELAKADSVLARRIEDYLGDPAVMQPGVVVELVSSTPQWFDRQNSIAWEILGDFTAAHALEGDFDLYLEGIRQGSPRRGLYYAGEVLDAYVVNDLARSSELLTQAPADDPLVRLARATLDGDAMAMHQVLDEGELDASPDASIARFALMRRVEALIATEELQEAEAIASAMVRRFPEFSVGYLVRADVLARRAVADSSDVVLSRSRLREALSNALDARDSKRKWSGPAGETVELATNICFLLDDAEKVCELALPQPLGCATPQEAGQAMVRRNLALALTRLGRYEDLVRIDLSDIPLFDQRLLRAWQAVQAEDDNAIPLMRAALDEAMNHADRASAYHGLAVLGIDPDEQVWSIEGLPDGIAELFGGIAANQRGEHELALERLGPMRWTSLECAECYGRTLLAQDRLEDAFRYFETAGGRLNAPQLYRDAARCLVRLRKFAEAEVLALRILALPASAEVEKSVRLILVEAAAGQQHWRTMNKYALAAADRFGDVREIGWATVVALVHQAKLEQAWNIFNTKLSDSVDPQFYLIEIQLRAQFDPSLQGTSRLLELAATVQDDPEHLAGVVGLLLTRHPERQWNDEQRTTFSELMRCLESSDPEGHYLQHFSVPVNDDDALIETMRERLEPGAAETAEHIDRVALGRMPYGTLRFVRELPYAEIVARFSAGALTAISADARIRIQEREIAAAALGQSVVVDTSSVVLWQTILDDGVDAIEYFDSILVPEELTSDVGWAQQSVLTSSRNTIGFDPFTQRLFVTETDEDVNNELHQSLVQLLEFMERCTIVPSGSFPWPEPSDDLSSFGPWDSSLRIASHLGHPLWVDDLALRQLAQHMGIRCFGTYALLEALRALPRVAVLPSTSEIQRRLMRHRIGDIPLTWDQIDDIAMQEDTSSVCFLLSRPANWRDMPRMFVWYEGRVAACVEASRHNEVPALTYSAILGMGRADAMNVAARRISGIVAAAVNSGINDGEVPTLVDVARQASRRLDPRGESDPLPAVVELLVQALSHSLAQTNVPRTAIVEHVVNLFRSMTEEDRHIVARAILEMEDDD